MTATIKVVSVLVVVFCCTEGQRPTVDTRLGRISGRLRRYGTELVLEFLGVPYAVPPVGRLRFKKPMARERWQGVLDASRFGPSCAQLGNTQFLTNPATSEDCLLLNIYIPRAMSPPRPRAVMIWIHGGGFVVGQGMGRDGARLALTGDVIVVTINYRLDVFGFLSTGDNQSRGNYGMWDQLLAIRWVKDNIAGFGGDSNKITIFGESGGGYSVGLLAATPQSRGLFQRAICESGTALSPRAIAFDPVSFMKRFSDNLGCTKTSRNGQFDTSNFMTCLRSRTTDDILRASATARRPTTLAWRLEIAPVVDGELIPRRPEFLLSPANREFYNPMRDIDYMAGTNNAEGGLVVWPLRNFQRNLNFDLTRGIPTRVFCENITPSIANDYFNGSRAIAEAICREYSSTRGLSEGEQARNVVNMYGDMMFVAPTLMSLLIHSRISNNRATYHYLFSREPQFRRTYTWFRGANHGDELPYVFGSSAAALQLSERMMEYWTNFARFGNPNGNPETAQTRWPRFKVTRKAYINLNTNITPSRDLYPRRMRFWISTVPNILNNGSTTTTNFPAWTTNRGITAHGSASVVIMPSIKTSLIFILVSLLC